LAHTLITIRKTESGTFITIRRDETVYCHAERNPLSQPTLLWDDMKVMRRWDTIAN
jgi:hypothetical protein